MSKDLRNWLWALLLLAGCVAILFASQPLTCHAKSIQCIDGDTFAINGTYFRLSNIDTPERGEEGYKEASDYTCNYLHHEVYKITTHGADKYGRTLATVGTLNTNLIKNCLAEPFYGKTTKEIVTYYKLKCK